MTALPTIRERCKAFITFCDGAEAVGFVDYARRGRAVADDLLRALDGLEGERSARRAVQERCDRLERILLERDGGLGGTA